ncbi:hypothetical protein ACFL6S_15420 [Candidatus Poribacteria bacterium]
MNIEQLKRRDAELKAKYNDLCIDNLLKLENAELIFGTYAEEAISQTRFSGGFISKIINFPRKLLRTVKPRTQSGRNKLYVEKETFQLQLDEDFVSNIRDFLRILAEEIKPHVQTRADFYWASRSYRMWLHHLLDRGIPLGDLSFTILSPQESEIPSPEEPMDVDVVENIDSTRDPMSISGSYQGSSAFIKLYNLSTKRSFK